MASTVSWMEKCMMCDGKGKIGTWDAEAKKISEAEECPCCEGRGYVMIRKSLLRKKA